MLRKWCTPIPHFPLLTIGRLLKLTLTMARILFFLFCYRQTKSALLFPSPPCQARTINSDLGDIFFSNPVIGISQENWTLEFSCRVGYEGAYSVWMLDCFFRLLHTKSYPFSRPFLINPTLYEVQSVHGKLRVAHRVPIYFTSPDTIALILGPNTHYCHQKTEQWAMPTKRTIHNWWTTKTPGTLKINLPCNSSIQRQGDGCTVYSAIFIIN